MKQFKVGQMIEVIDQSICAMPMLGEIVELDTHPFEYSKALIRVEGSSLPKVEVWVNLRLAKCVDEAMTTQHRDSEGI